MGRPRIVEMLTGAKDKFKPPNPLDQMPTLKDEPPPPAPTVQSQMPEVKATRRAQPIDELNDLPALPTRTPLADSEKKGFKNRAKGFWEGMGASYANGARGLEVLGGGAGGAINRETANRQLWEKNVELPVLKKRKTQEDSILKRQKGYDAAMDAETRVHNADTNEYRVDASIENNKRTVAGRIKTTTDQINGRASEGKLNRESHEKISGNQIGARAAEGKANREAAEKRTRIVTDAAGSRQRQGHVDRMEEKYVDMVGADGGDYEPTDSEINEALKFSPAGTTKEQAIADLKAQNSKKSKSKPGAGKAAEIIRNAYGGHWGKVPAGK